MQEYLLDKEYELDIVFSQKEFFGDNAVGSLKLSPSGITFTVICYRNYQQEPTVIRNKIMPVLHCTTLKHEKITLFNTKLISSQSVINLGSEIHNTKLMFTVQYCIIGNHIKSFDDELFINKIKIKQNTLKQWIDKSIVSLEFHKDKRQYIYKIDCLPSFYKTDIDETSAIEFFISATHQFYKGTNPSYNINYYIIYIFSKLKSIKEALRYVKSWVILFGLFMGQLYNIDSVSFVQKNNTDCCYFYFTRIKRYPQDLVLQEVPVPCKNIKSGLKNILPKWFKMDDKMKHSATLFYKSLKSTFDEDSFLDAVKAIEPFTDEFNDTYFDIIFLKKQIFPEIKEKLKNTLNNNELNMLKNSLLQANKHKYNLEARLKKLVSMNNLNSLNLDNTLISYIVSYRNTLSHNGGEEKYSQIDTKIMFEAYSKIRLMLFILFLKYLGISPQDIDYALIRYNF